MSLSVTFTMATDLASRKDRHLAMEEEDCKAEETASTKWVEDYLESSLGLEAPGLQVESLFRSGFAVNCPAYSITMEEGAISVAEPLSEHTAPLRPKSPESSDSSYPRSASLLPRHKRPSHKRAETKRRNKIKNRLDDVKVLISSTAHNGKLSESTILSGAADYTKHLLEECERCTTEAANLRQEIESLSTEIHSFQEDLPAAGLKIDTVVKEQELMLDQLYRTYVASQTGENWKFFLFKFFMKPLFQSYKTEVSTNNLSLFMASVNEWASERLCLSNLRHQALEQMKDITRKTDILNHPESLPEQAMASVAQTSSGDPESPSDSSFSLSSCCRPRLSSKFMSASSENCYRQMQTKANHKNITLSLFPARQRFKSCCYPTINMKAETTCPAHGQTVTYNLFSDAGRTLPFSLMDAASHDSPVDNHAISSIQNFMPTNLAAPQQSVTSIPTSMADITQLVTSIGETTTRPMAVTPLNFSLDSHPSGSCVACLVTGSGCHEYDFDITDIPDLLESAVLSPQPLVSSSSPFSSASFTTFIETCPCSPSHLTTHILSSGHLMQPPNPAKPAVSADAKVSQPSKSSWS